MSSVAMLAAAEMLAALSILMLGVQLLWLRYRERRGINEHVRQRMSEIVVLADDTEKTAKLNGFEKVLLRADIRLSRAKLATIAGLILVFIASVAVLRGGLVAAITALIVAVCLLMYWRFRFQKQRRLIYEELPGIIDSVLRYMSAGRSLESALVEAFKEASEVFSVLEFRLRSAVESGRSYTELFDEYAQLYKVPPLILVSIALHTSARFGSSIQPVFRQVADSLRSQQELRRVFLAATAEIRFTAAVFALLPMGLAAYMVLMNEKYSAVLLQADTGHMMLGVAGALQGVAMLSLIHI